MKNRKNETVWDQDSNVVPPAPPKKEGKSWKVVMTCRTFQEADGKRKQLRKQWSEVKQAGAEAKIKRSNATGLFTVRTREADAPPVQVEKKQKKQTGGQHGERQEKTEKDG